MQQHEVMRRAIDAFNSTQTPYALVGSLASGIWGEPRMTLDIDVVARFGNQVDAFCQQFPEDDFYLSLPAAHEAVNLGGQFNIIHMASGNKIDVMTVPDSPWTRSQLARRRQAELLPGVTGYVAAPEDVILGKLLYYREGGSDKHLRDIRGIFAVSSAIIDPTYLETWVGRLGLVEAWNSAQAWL